MAKVDVIKLLFLPFNYSGNQINVIILNGVIMTIWFITLLTLLLTCLCVIRKEIKHEKIKRKAFQKYREKMISTVMMDDMKSKNVHFASARIKSTSIDQDIDFV